MSLGLSTTKMMWKVIAKSFPKRPRTFDDDDDDDDDVCFVLFSWLMVHESINNYHHRICFYTREPYRTTMNSPEEPSFHPSNFSENAQVQHGDACLGGFGTTPEVFFLHLLLRRRCWNRYPKKTISCSNRYIKKSHFLLGVASTTFLGRPY